jgi:ABC-2 type transport system permease protein
VIGRIVRHELRSAWRDGRLRGVLLLTLVLLAAAVLVGAANVRDLEAQRAEAAALERTNWLEQGPKNPHGAAHFGQYAFKPVSGLALFDRGVDRYLGVALWLEAHRRNPLVHRPADDAPAVQRFGDWCRRSCCSSRRPRA